MRARSSLTALSLAAMIAVPGTALAQDAYSRASTWLRAGPGTNYPSVARVSRGEALDIYGCLRGRSWCDVSADGDRGWIRGGSIDYVYNGRRVIITNPAVSGLTILSFGMADYWDRHYSSRPWYRDNRYWRGRDRDRHPDRRGPDRRRDGMHDRPGPDRTETRPQPPRPEAATPRPERPTHETTRPRPVPDARSETRTAPDNPRRPMPMMQQRHDRAERPATRPSSDRPRPAMQQPPRPERGSPSGAEPRRPQAPAGGPGPGRCPPGGDCR